MTNIKSAFGKAVRLLRQKRGISQEGFAATAKIGRSYMGKIERGEVNVSLENIAKIAGALGVSSGELFAAVDQAAARR